MNRRRKKLFFKDATQKSAPLVLGGIAVELEPSLLFTAHLINLVQLIN